MMTTLRFVSVCALSAIAICCSSPDGKEQRLRERARKDDFFALDHLARIEIQMKPADWTALKAEQPEGGRCGKSYAGQRFTWFGACAVAVEGERFESDSSKCDPQGPLRIRKKAYCGSLSQTKPAMRLQWAGPLAERARAAVLGSAELVLNNNEQDPALVRQCLAHQLARQIGVPAPRCGLAKVVVNGEYLGIYSTVEAIDQEFLGERFGSDDGLLFEVLGGDFTPGSFADIQIKQGQPAEGTARLTAASEAIAAKDPALIAERIDLDAFIQLWATELILSHGDGFANWRNNTFLYLPPGDPRFRFIAWGTDKTWREPPFLYRKEILARLLETDPRYVEQLHSKVMALLADNWREDAIIDRVESLHAALLPQLGPESPIQLTEEIDRLRDAILAQRAALEDIFREDAAKGGEPYCRDRWDHVGLIQRDPLESFEGPSGLTWGAASWYSAALDVARAKEFPAEGSFSLALRFAPETTTPSALLAARDGWKAIFEVMMPQPLGVGPNLESRLALRMEIYNPGVPLLLAPVISTGPSWKWQEAPFQLPLTPGWNHGVTIPLAAGKWAGLDDVRRISFVLRKDSQPVTADRIYLDALRWVAAPGYRPQERGFQRGRPCLYPTPADPVPGAPAASPQN